MKKGKERKKKSKEKKYNKGTLVQIYSVNFNTPFVISSNGLFSSISNFTNIQKTRSFFVLLKKIQTAPDGLRILFQYIA